MGKLGSLSNFGPEWRPVLGKAAIEAARFEGATSPNPPVAAAALDASGSLLGIAAHHKAGSPHAEARLIADLRERGALDSVDTMVVTLEPCNHQGRTPPCTEALLALPRLRRVVYGARDPNPRVAGSGAARLASAGLEVQFADDPACRELIRPFSHFIVSGRPWVTIKTAHQQGAFYDSMIPPAGQRTFTSEDSLTLAHRLRRRADAILTGSGTVLADDPSFTVRHVEDLRDRPRLLLVLDRRRQVSGEWLKSAEKRGFEVHRCATLDQAWARLSDARAMEVLVEAGPTLSRAILDGGFWNEHVLIRTDSSGGPDRVEHRIRE